MRRPDSCNAVHAAPLAGVVYGSFQALMPVLASELFDMQRFATLYVVLQQATLTGSYLLANRLVRLPSTQSKSVK